MIVGVAIGDGGVRGGVGDDCKVSNVKGDEVSDEVVDNGVNDPK
jgi:hypothetical protein